jgi:prephenate dehydrogenase
MEMPFEHVVIVGCGLLGASLGLAMRKKSLAKGITGVGRRGSASLSVAHQRGAIDRESDDPAAAVRDAQLVILCTPVRQFPEMFRAIAPALPPGAIVTDVGSTKSEVMRWAHELLPAHVEFIGSHPMAGSEKSGPEAAREDLYQNAVCLVCRPSVPGAAADAAHQRVTALWRDLGMRIVDCDAAQHDEWVAAASHLPHAIATTLMNVVGANPAALDVAAGGFTDTTRIASGDVAMWTDIFLTNRDAVRKAISEFEVELEKLRDAVEHGEESAIRGFLSKAKAARDAFTARRRK